MRVTESHLMAYPATLAAVSEEKWLHCITFTPAKVDPAHDLGEAGSLGRERY